MERYPCAHIFADHIALLKESMRKDCWQLKRTCTRCGEVLYPTRGTLTVMGIVDELCLLLSLMLGLFAARTLLVDQAFLVKLLVGLTVCLVLRGILRAVTRPILLAARWEPMDARIGDIPREKLLQQWYGKTVLWTTVCLTVLALIIYLVMFA